MRKRVNAFPWRVEAVGLEKLRLRRRSLAGLPREAPELPLLCPSDRFACLTGSSSKRRRIDEE
jgi:hypothetical protein